MSGDVRFFESLGYVLRFPENYVKGQQYPVILLLHGAGSRGDDPAILMQNPAYTLTARHNDFPFVLIMPQCHQNTWLDLFEQLQRFVKAMAAEDFADPHRFYLMGTSMGGYAAWQLAMSLPELFAAMVPICGGGMYWNAARLKNLPIWAFHGGQDNTVKPEESVKMVDAVNKHGGSAKLTIYPENKHDAWSDTYSNPDVFLWLLRHKRAEADLGSDNFQGSNLYG